MLAHPGVGSKAYHGVYGSSRSRRPIGAGGSRPCCQTIHAATMAGTSVIPQAIHQLERRERLVASALLENRMIHGGWLPAQPVVWITKTC